MKVPIFAMIFLLGLVEPPRSFAASMAGLRQRLAPLHPAWGPQKVTLFGVGKGRNAVEDGKGSKTTVTTIRNPKAPCPFDKVDRECMSADQCAVVVDFTHVHTWTGFV